MQPGLSDACVGDLSRSSLSLLLAVFKPQRNCREAIACSVVHFLKLGPTLLIRNFPVDVDRGNPPGMPKRLLHAKSPQFPVKYWYLTPPSRNFCIEPMRYHVLQKRTWTEVCILQSKRLHKACQARVATDRETRMAGGLDLAPTRTKKIGRDNREKYRSSARGPPGNFTVGQFFELPIKSKPREGG